VLWEARQGPWENGAFSGRAADCSSRPTAATTWRKIGKGLPTFEQDGLGRIGITVAPSMPSRMFATVGATRGAVCIARTTRAKTGTPQRATPRIVARADFAEVKVDPKNPDIVYTASVVAWKSTDGGKTFKAFRGAPGGDDYHRIWINPEHAHDDADRQRPGRHHHGERRRDVELVVQPADGACSTTSPRTTRFPYRVCSGQQESGSACVSSRGDDGRITFANWHPVGVEEYGYVAPDPLDPDIVYGGKVSRYDRRPAKCSSRPARWPRRER
jgi:hypothetical protein